MKSAYCAVNSGPSNKAVCASSLNGSYKKTSLLLVIIKVYKNLRENLRQQFYFEGFQIHTGAIKNYRKKK